VTTRTAAPLKVTAELGQPFVGTERVFEAPRELVFRCWSDPGLVSRWLGPNRMTMRIDEWSFHDGGRYRYVHVDDHGTEYGFHGVFHGDPTADRMIQTFEFEGAPGHVSLDRLELVDLGEGRTLARTHTVFQSLEARDAMVDNGMADGLGQGYERLDEILAGLRGGRA
jgi:uncharacterized protein YndB with AHSA1/START domain